MSKVQLATLCYVRSPEKGTLLVHRNKNKGDLHLGKWNGLGGKIAPGESPEQCVIREVCEESGLNIFNPVLAGILTFPCFSTDTDWYVFVFTANQFDGSLHECDEGSLEWVTDELLFSLPMWEGDRIFLPLVMSGKLFSGRFCYREGILVEHEINIYKANT
ncbi:MAG TPA: 8-oxo-dGTP diphosphatase [Oligoflexia bacterium]|nr:8-oxo-dGTP diphosphatase [Oligoflexia bacterium]HMP47221.1 8-oxo-dGTP diphosphatase [Oligoflexia bacterium]